MPARVRLPTVGAIGRLSIFERFASRYPCWLALAGIPPLTGVSLSSLDMRGLTFGNVGSMTTCQVLRCPSPGATVITGGHNLGRINEAFICEEHKAAIDAGAHWDRQETQVLIGQDVAPTLAKVSVRDSEGTQGFTLTLETEDQANPFSVFVTPENVKYLSMIFSSRGE